MAQVALPLAATAFSVAGQVQKGKAAKKAADSEASQLEANARRRLQMGQSQADEIQRQTARFMSDLSAAQGGSGFSGSDAAAIRQAARAAGVGKHNELAALYESRMDAEGMRRGASNARTQGRYARRSAYLGAAATAFGGVSSAFGGGGGRMPQTQDNRPLFRNIAGMTGAPT